MGIEFKLNTEVGRDVQLEDLLKDYDAVFLGVGTYQSMRGGLENEDADGVFDALPFLIANTKQIMGFGETSDETICQHGRQTRGGAGRRRYRNGLRTYLHSSGRNARNLCLSS
ncbi:glutamate synthase [Salmonella enterica subsp. enterica]|uniref:Glutamate synthase n=1 Tax=Salmonella enterica I TaxID=59201 RepID=A0A3S5DME6_SALET|nr:glutamate synthase [Salmonella enterica subsp. enterica]